MLIDLQVLEDVRSKFMDLGRSVSSLSGDINTSIQDVQSALSAMQRTLQTAVSTEDVQRISTAADEIARVSGQYADHLDRFEGTLGTIDTFSDALGAASERFEELATDIQNLTDAAPQGQPAKEAEKAARRRKPKKVGPPGLLKKEYGAVKGKVRGFMSALKIPAIGAVAAGGIAWMAYGFQEKDRLRAQAGEAMNIMVAAYDGMSKEMVRKGTAYVAAFQERMSQFFGIAKEEVQSVAKAFTEGGISIEEMLSGFDRKLGGIGKNFISFSLGLDKMYELPGGTSAQRMVKYAEDYGKSMEDAKDTLQKLYFLGQESGLGAQAFVDIVERSGDSLRKLGFNIDAIADLAVKMQDSFEKIGVPKKFAGRQIALGLDQMASGIANMNEGWQSLIAEKMGYGKGLEGRQRLMEASTRVAEGRSEAETEKFIVTTVNTVTEAVQGDAVRARYILERDLGFGFEGARIAKMIADAANAGDRTKSKEITKKYRKQLSDALMTERQKQSKFQRHMNEWMKGLADIGQGLLGLVGNFLVSLVSFFKTGYAMLTGQDKKGAVKHHNELLKDIKKDNEKYKDLIGQGFGKLGKAGGHLAKDVMGSTFKNLQRAMDLDMGGGAPEESPMAPRQRQVPLPEIPSTVKMVPIPASKPGVYEAGTPQEKYKSWLAEVSAHTKRIGEDPWVGGELHIISEGVDEEGNLNVGLVGNCPKCGLQFGEGFDLAGYQRDLDAVPKPGEVEVINPNTGRALTADPTTKQGMSDIANLGRGRSSRKAGVEGTMDPRLGKILQGISERFPGRRIQLYSGHREGEKGQHGKGTAMDIGVEGVSSEDLFRYIRSNVKGGGKGYYPDQPFVHVDVRPGTAVWVDFSKKGAKGKTLGGAEANEWLTSNVGWERGGETSKRYSIGPNETDQVSMDFAQEQSVME